jgi:homoserine O-acetyltransferase
MMKRLALASLFCLALAPVIHANRAFADDMIVEKRVFDMPELTTIGGKTIKGVRVGWEAYGTLNAEKSNAILVTHYFSGTSHAAGKYAAGDAAPGYWDSIIGPGKAVDTNKYYVISSDTLVNLNPGDPHVTTTGPASVDPSTGKPYAMRFPIVTIGDFVNVQKALLDSLGVKRLHAVMGASMGGLQTYEWAASYPDRVERIIPVISAAVPHPWLVAWTNIWASPILLDAKWNGGDYYGGERPVEGLKTALKTVTLQALQSQWADQKAGMAWADPAKNPLGGFDAPFKIEAALDSAAAAREKTADANHFLYLVKANQTFFPGAAGGAKSAEEGLKKIKAKTLILYSPTDQVFSPEWIKETATAIRANGTEVETAEIGGPLGHFNGVANIAPLGPKIADFLGR